MRRRQPFHRRLLTLIHFLVWAATKRHDFKFFEIGVTPLVKFWFRNEQPHCCLVVEIALSKPKAYHSVPWRAIEEYSERFTDLSFLKIDDDIPF